MADTPDIVERLTEAREEMHRRGLDSAFHNARMQAQRWGSVVGLALIELASQRDEIERLRRTAPAGEVRAPLQCELEAARDIVAADDQHKDAGQAWAWDMYKEEAIVKGASVARALLALSPTPAPVEEG